MLGNETLEEELVQPLPLLGVEERGQLLTGSVRTKTPQEGLGLVWFLACVLYIQ